MSLRLSPGVSARCGAPVETDAALDVHDVLRGGARAASVVRLLDDAAGARLVANVPDAKGTLQVLALAGVPVDDEPLLDVHAEVLAVADGVVAARHRVAVPRDVLRHLQRRLQETGGERY